MVLVVLKAFDILELVAARKGQAISLTEIANELKLSQATAANIIQTLVHRGYLEHIGRKKGYRLGPTLSTYNNEMSPDTALIEAARGPMEALTAEINESTILGTLRNNKRYILHVVNAMQEVQVQVRTERNVYETASGRLLLAYFSDAELTRFVQQNGLPDRALWRGADSMEGMSKALMKIREAELATTHIPNRYVRGFAVPVWHGEKAVAGLSVFLPDYRCTPAKERSLLNSLRDAAAKISSRIGSDPI